MKGHGVDDKGRDYEHQSYLIEDDDDVGFREVAESTVVHFVSDRHALHYCYFILLHHFIPQQ